MTEDRKIRVVLADDEPLAREGLADLLAQIDDIELVASARNGAEAIEMIVDKKPDLVFLDIEMPLKTGLEVVGEIGPENMPAVIFSTAYDQYAIEAFELAAIDYVLKPLDPDRLAAAIDRVRKGRGASTNVERLSDVLPSDRPKYLQRIAVEKRGQEKILEVGSIDFISASGPYAEIYVGETMYLVRVRMQTLEDRLDPKKFFRIHRSTIVRMEEIDTLVNGSGGDYSILMRNGKRLKIGRGRRDALRESLGLDNL